MKLLLKALLQGNAVAVWRARGEGGSKADRVQHGVFEVLAGSALDATGATAQSCPHRSESRRGACEDHFGTRQASNDACAAAKSQAD